MAIDVSKDVETSINAAVQSGRFSSAAEMVSELVREYVERSSDQPVKTEHQAPIPPKPIWEMAAELRASIPAEEWAKLPVDGARQHDHYIHGTPKRPE